MQILVPSRNIPLEPPWPFSPRWGIVVKEYNPGNPNGLVVQVGDWLQIVAVGQAAESAAGFTYGVAWRTDVSGRWAPRNLYAGWMPNENYVPHPHFRHVAHLLNEVRQLRLQIDAAMAERALVTRIMYVPVPAARVGVSTCPTPSDQGIPGEIDHARYEVRVGEPGDDDSPSSIEV